MSLALLNLVIILRHSLELRFVNDSVRPRMAGGFSRASSACSNSRQGLTVILTCSAHSADDPALAVGLPTMKIRSVVTLVGLAISFALPTFAQQRDTADPRIAQQRDLLGVAKALEEFGEFHQALDEAYKKNDAAAVAAFFTEDAVLVEPDGVFSGRQDIEKRYADTFQHSPIIRFNSTYGRSHLNAIDNAVWAVGLRKSSFKSQTGSVFAVGYWSAIYVREGDAWKIRMLTLNEQPPPAPRA